MHHAPEQARQHLDGAIAVAAAEVERLERAVQDLTAAGQLAGLVQDRATSGEYRERLGLMTQIRLDFEAMAELLLAASTTTTRAGTDLGAMRSPEPVHRNGWRARRSQRYQLPRSNRTLTSQATGYRRSTGSCCTSTTSTAAHPNESSRSSRQCTCCSPGGYSSWSSPSIRAGSCAAIASHYRDLFATEIARPAGATQMRNPASYQELGFETGPPSTSRRSARSCSPSPPLDERGYHQLVDSLVGFAPTNRSRRRSGEATSTFRRGTRRGRRRRGGGGADGPGHHLRKTRYADRFRDGDQRQVLPTESLTDCTSDRSALALTADELRLMAQLGPPLITAPRAVKRLTNSYGDPGSLSAADARTGTAQSSTPSPTSSATTRTCSTTISLSANRVAYPYRAGMVLLAAVIGYPDLGPRAVHRAVLRRPINTRPRLVPWLRDQGHLTSGRGFEPTTTGSRDNRHAAMTWLEALNYVSHQAAEAGLPLPQRLDTWAAWVIPVGRLSFPTGPAVTRLMSRPRRTSP